VSLITERPLQIGCLNWRWKNLYMRCIYIYIYMTIYMQMCIKMNKTPKTDSISVS